MYLGNSCAIYANHKLLITLTTLLLSHFESQIEELILLQLLRNVFYMFLSTLLQMELITNIWTSPGKGALVKVQPDDKYYYPACFLAQNLKRGFSTVHMWRGIHNTYAGKTFTQVPNARIVGALYSNAPEQRLISVSIYFLIWNVMDNNFLYS